MYEKTDSEIYGFQKDTALILEEIVSIENINKFAQKIIPLIKNKDVFILEGDLGYGKTTLVRSMARALSAESIVSSPTFTIINEYDIIMRGEETVMRHIDLYRLRDVSEVYALGLFEIINENGVSFIEWGDKFIEIFKNCYKLKIEMIDENTRKFTLTK